MPLNAPTRTVADFSPSAQGYVWNAPNWTQPTPTPQAAASFSAAIPTNTLGTDGIIQFDSNSKINEEIPNSGGLRGWRFNYAAQPDPEGDPPNNELRGQILIPQSRTWEIKDLWIPSNYEHRAFFYADTSEPLSTFSGWQAGDTLSASGTATFVYAKDKGSYRRIFVKDSSQAYVEWLFGIGNTVTNARTSDTFTVTGRNFTQSNNKLSSHWVGAAYPNGAFTVETTGTPIAGSFAPNSRLLMAASGSDFQTAEDDLANAMPSPPLDPVVPWDIGARNRLLIERERSSTSTSGDGGYGVYIQNTTYPTWTKIFENKGFQSFSTTGDNKFSNFFLMGYSNSGFASETRIHLIGYDFWTQKPPELIAAGY